MTILLDHLVLPTSQTAKFSSGVTITDFMRRNSLINCSKDSFAKLAADTEALAETEGLFAHAESIRIRNENKNPHINGLLLINKPQNIASFKVTKTIERKLGVKTGHAGTLDPFAEGLMIIGINKSNQSA